MKVCDLAHQLVSGLLRIRGIEDWLRFAFACRHEASARIAVNFGGWRAAHAQGQSAKRRADSSSEGNTRAVSSMFRVGRFVQQGVENLVGRCVVVALARP